MGDKIQDGKQHNSDKTTLVHFNRQNCLMFQGQCVRALGELTAVLLMYVVYTYHVVMVKTIC